MDENRNKLLDMYKEKHSIYKDFLDTKNGIAILDDLEKEYCMSKSTVRNPHDIDTKSMIWAEAQRAVVLRIKNLASGTHIEKPQPENKKENL